MQVEEILMEELRHNKSKYDTFIMSPLDWNRVLRKKLAISKVLSMKRVIEMEVLKEVIEILSRKKFDEARRVEVRKQISMKSWYSLHSIIFRVGKDTRGYAAIVYIPELSRDNEKSKGVIFAARHLISGRLEDIKFENAKFNNYLSEVKPYIEILGNLFRRTRRI